jgi:DNA-directed RNA polymerase specialized sigma24 family protein
MRNSRLSSTAQQNRLLVKIYHEARKHAIGAVRQEDVEDVVQDVVIHCQVKLRSRAWIERPRNVRAFVRKLVRDAVADRRRRQTRDDENGRQYLGAGNAFEPEWVTPGHEWHEEDIVEFQLDSCHGSADWLTTWCGWKASPTRPWPGD